jgi:TetR/AcrR family acrAB operon transcriptional repressor
MRRTKEEAAITRETVLKVALSVFSAKGYAATSLEDIAREAEVTRGAIYWHFKSKADLYNTLVESVSARANTVVQQAAAEGGSLTEVLQRIFVRQLSLIEEDSELRALAELMLFKMEQTPELASRRKKQIESGKALIAEIANVMRQGIRQGVLRSDLDPDDIARAFLALQNGAIQLWLLAPKSFSLKKSAEGLARILLAGIEAKV